MKELYISGHWKSNGVLFSNAIACIGDPRTDTLDYSFINLPPEHILGEHEDIVVSHLELMFFSVWAGGAEINQYPVSWVEAKELFDNYVADGYDDVVIEPLPPKG